MSLAEGFRLEGVRSIRIAAVGNLIFVASESLDRGRPVSTPNTAAAFLKK